VYIHIQSVLRLIHSSDLSDNGDPLNGIVFVVAVSHVLVTVLKTLKNVSRILDEVRRGILLPNKRHSPFTDYDRCFSTLVLGAFSAGVFQHQCITPH
jgi:hypothetical protein